ncbi:hypothetical protein ORIO_04225 [Cereibacter azotoformans]|uniref:hypothetical protein n=1 Tax=Cereibacter azotoformans TaxID=43057 RepID=UPI001EEBD15B|nr:hypothetical protein [Cereibacter azotoformans]ULB09134.1 hypothetical protein ORIO_04225 [Cereibacter azotoformans]
MEKVSYSLPADLLPRIEAARSRLQEEFNVRVSASAMVAGLLKSALDQAVRDAPVLAAQPGRRRRA